MKRFLIGLALCFMPVFSFALPVCADGKISFTCSEDGANKQCQFYEYYAGTVRDCELPEKYKDENGRACFKNGDVSPCEKHNDDGKQPKTDKPPEGGKQPKEQGCFEFEGHRGRTEAEVCKAAGWNYIGRKMVCNKDGTYANGRYLKPGNNAISGNIQYDKSCQEEEKQPKQPKQPEQKEPKQPAPNDGKQPKHEDGKQPKHEDGKQPKHDEGKQPKGEGQGEDSGDGNGKGSKGEGSGKGEGSDGGSGKGSKGEGNGKGEGSGDAEGKGMFKGGAGSGQLGDVRVPKSRDGMGWKGDFFLRNPNQCPQDKTMNVLGRSITFSYAKLCGFLDMLAPVIKAVFMFIAGMLVVKSIRAK